MKKFLKIVLAVCSVLVFSTPISASSEYLKEVERIEFGNGYMQYMYQVEDGLLLGGAYESGAIVLKLDKQNNEVWRYTMDDVQFPHILATSDDGVLINYKKKLIKLTKDGNVEWQTDFASTHTQVSESESEYVAIVEEKTALPYENKVSAFRYSKVDGSLIGSKLLYTTDDSQLIAYNKIQQLSNGNYVYFTYRSGELSKIHILDSNFNEIRFFDASDNSSHLYVEDDLILSKKAFGYDIFDQNGALVHNIVNDDWVFDMKNISIDGDVLSILQADRGFLYTLTQYSLDDNKMIKKLPFGDPSGKWNFAFSNMLFIDDLIYVSASIDNKSSLLIYKIMSDDEEKKEDVVVDNDNTVDPVNKQATLPATGDNTQTNLYVGLACLAAFVVYRVRKNQA